MFFADLLERDGNAEGRQQRFQRPVIEPADHQPFHRHTRPKVTAKASGSAMPAMTACQPVGTNSCTT
jgi:hypothetical protein